ncbi:MAG: GTP pyrophosphokinase, partial [Bacteroidota bacterium]|nr:GTP pyrophosphokinase [Bacteroidota bacterium]
DDVIGYLTEDDNLIIQKTKCAEAIKLMASHGDRIIAARWTPFKIVSYLTHLQLKGFDRIGVVSEITAIISKEHNINMRSVKFETHDGIFEGELFLYIHNTLDLNNLIFKLMKVKGVDYVERIEDIEE